MKVIALAGKTSTSKDTIAKYIREKYGIDIIVSYATRKIRASETDGVEHYFIDNVQMDELVKDESKLLAFVEFKKTKGQTVGNRYCATSRDLSEDDVVSYVIDPNGIEWLKEHRSDVEVITIFLDLEETIIRERALKRGDKLDDINARLDSERDVFDTFAANLGYDERIYTGDALHIIYEKVDNILSKYGIKAK